MPKSTYQVECESPKGQRVLEWFYDSPMSKVQAAWLVDYVEKICGDSADSLGLRIVPYKS